MGFWNRVMKNIETVGYYRAARELDRMGMHKEAFNVRKNIKR